MKSKIYSLLSALMLLAGLSACQSPEKLVSTGDEHGILQMKAFFIDDERTENEFNAVIDYDARLITIIFPYNYPRVSDNVLSAEWLTNVRVTAVLSNNSTITPELTTLDLTHDNIITVTNPFGVSTDYTVRAEVRKSDECDLLEFSIPSAGLDGIIDHEAGTVTLLAVENVGAHTAKYEVSAHATISPDPTLMPIDFDADDAKVTVIAQDGVTMRDYRFIKGEPTKLLSGMRAGSEKVMWIKKLSELNVTALNTAAGIGVLEDKIVINEKGNNQAVVISRSDGSVIGTMDLSITGGQNHYMTSDHAGHIMVNTWGSDGILRVWIFDGLTNGRELFSTAAYGCGSHLSVYGDLTGDAIITGGISGTNFKFLRWKVTKGVVGPAETVTCNGIPGTIWANSDIISTSATNANADYLVCLYGAINGLRGPAMFNGTTDKVKFQTVEDISSNWVLNACDYVKFNKGEFAIHNTVNTFTWGTDDSVYFYDISGSNFATPAVDFSATGLDINGNYGARACGNIGIANNCNDVRLWPSADGFYLYAYFMFTNGCIGCVRVDCIDR